MNELGNGKRLQAALLPAPCCTHDCNQGRDCPRAKDGERAAIVAVGAVTVVAVIAGIVHFAARMGWV